MNDVVNEELKTITLDQLLPGDILGFKGDSRDPVSFLIMELTGGSDVSHGALFLQNKDNVLAESGGDGIHSRKMIEDLVSGREVYVLRHKDAGPNGVEPVVPIAKDYVLQDLPYPYSDLILLGLILVFKKKISKKWISRPVVEFLCLVAAELKTIIEQQKTSGKHTMVCSSFVYQCYLDASKEHPNLKLDVKDGDVGFKEHALLGAKNASPSVSLFDLFDEYATTYGENFENHFAANKALLKATKLRSKEDILADLKKQLLDKTNALPVLMGGELSIVVDIVRAIKDVIEAFTTFIKGEKPSFAEMMKIAREQQALFVTPNDLVNHLTNVNKLGLAKVHCDNERYDQNL